MRSVASQRWTQRRPLPYLEASWTGWSGSTAYAWVCRRRVKASVQQGWDRLQVGFSWCAVCCYAGWHRAGAPRVTAVNRDCPWPWSLVCGCQGSGCRMPARSWVCLSCSSWGECLPSKEGCATQLIIIRVQGIITWLTRDALAAQGCANYYPPPAPASLSGNKANWRIPGYVHRGVLSEGQASLGKSNE